jgi:lysyl-tRNA synthetase class 2
MNPSLKIAAARFRAERLAAVRAFFAERKVLEVETPLLSRGASHDFHIDVFVVPHLNGTRYLQTSPELHMKRLLARGYPDIYQVCKSFRLEEEGGRHNPEFTMIEWYRLGFKLRRMMEETVALCAVVAGARETSYFSYENVFQRVTGLHPIKSKREALLALPVFAERGHKVENQPADFPTKADVLNFIFSEVVEPTFDPNAFTVVHHWPIEMAAQAEPDQEEPFLAQRFEVYAGGMELGNGYKELIDTREYRARFEAENKKRAAGGKPEIPLHEGFFHDLDGGLPACAGVAVGFDRLLMLGAGTKDLAEILEFGWGEA